MSTYANLEGLDSVRTKINRAIDRVVDVRDFGAVGDGVTDDTSAIQAAIDYAQGNGGGVVWLPPLRFAVSGLTYDGDLPLSIVGAGAGSFGSPYTSGSSTSILLTDTGAKLFERSGGGNNATKLFSSFHCENVSGGFAETCFHSENGTFCNFSDLTINGFSRGIRHQKTVYSEIRNVQIRSADNGFDFTNITSTPPLILNQLSSSGFYNNLVSFKNCAAVSCGIGYKIAGVTANLDCVDASNCSTVGIRIGGSDYNASLVSATQIYVEGITANAIEIENSMFSALGAFVGSNAAAALSAINSRAWIGMLRSYASVSVGVAATSSRVRVEGYEGTFTTPFTLSGTAKVTMPQRLDRSYTSFSLDDGESVDIAVSANANRPCAVDLAVNENGGTKTFVRCLLEGGNLYVGVLPSNMALSSQIDGNGNYNLRISNNAGFAYNLSGYAMPAVLSEEAS